jgi:TusA-related sulfurtransferase
VTFDKDLDVTGKACPIPLITLAREVRGLAKGRAIRITGNDPLFEDSVVDFCRERRHEILEISREGRTVRIAIRI